MYGILTYALYDVMVTPLASYGVHMSLFIGSMFVYFCIPVCFVLGVKVTINIMTSGGSV